MKGLGAPRSHVCERSRACWLKFWRTAVASCASCATPLMLSSSWTPSGAVSLTDSLSRTLLGRLSNQSWLPRRVMMTSHEYTDRGVHMSAVRTLSVMNTRALPSEAIFLRTGSSDAETERKAHDVLASGTRLRGDTRSMVFS